LGWYWQEATVGDIAMVPSSQVRSFRDLDAWRSALERALDVHRAALTLPAFERFELGRQLRRCATSIPSNVAEGFNRHSRAAYRLHVSIALGSVGELETQLELCRCLDYFDDGHARTLIGSADRVARLLQGLWRSLK
jgi:four helix bundle protein